MANSSGGKPLLIACGGCAILFIGFLLVSVGGALTLTQGATNAARLHVTLVKDGKLDEAYGALGEGFKKSVTLEQFKAFVANKPVLYQGDDLTLKNRQVENDAALISGTTTQGKTTTEVRFELKKEGSAWRIARIEIGPSTRPALDAANEHVQLVKEGKVEEAWEATSSAFQASTSAQAFADFVKRTGSLYRSKSLELPFSRMKAEGVAQVEGKAVGPDGKTYDVRFQLRFEADEWKISLVNVRDPALAPPEAAKAKTAEAKAAETKTAETKTAD